MNINEIIPGFYEETDWEVYGVQFRRTIVHHGVTWHEFILRCRHHCDVCVSVYDGELRVYGEQEIHDEA